MELIGGCLSGYGAMAILPSKADRIMSRYRPIAPKPTMPCLSEADRSDSPATSFDNLYCRQVPNSTTTAPAAKQKIKRVRKRQKRETTMADTQRPSKRSATVSSSKPDSLKSCMGEGLGCGLVREGPQMMMTEEDAGFMERAAASAPSSVFPFEKRRKAIWPSASNNNGYGGCFTEMIRGIAGLPTAAHVHNLLQNQEQQLPTFLNVIQQQPLIQQSPRPLDQDNLRDYAKEELSSDAFWACFAEDSMGARGERNCSEEQQQSGLDEEDYEGNNEGRRNLTTLNLLPEAPSRGDSPTSSTCSSSSHILPHKSASANSYAYIMQVYSHSSEPVVVVQDGNQEVLWVNQAYERAWKDKSSMLPPFIDPLGIPTQLGHLKLQKHNHGGCTSATLWGFLKKLIVETANLEPTRWAPNLVGFPFRDAKLSEQEDSESAASFKGLVRQHHSHGAIEQRNGPYITSTAPIITSNASMTTRVIMPQPIRLVGSAVSLDSITEIEENEAMAGSVEIVEKQLEEGSLPAFITDASNLVRWVNTAYKHMLGQPECPWLDSTVKAGGAPPTITGEVLLSCNVEIPPSARSFSGRANIQWTRHTGERSSMTVPCDVCSLTDSNCKRMLVWKFDIQACLSLTCGVGW